MTKESNLQKWSGINENLNIHFWAPKNMSENFEASNYKRAIS